MGLTLSQENIDKLTFPRIATAELCFSFGWTAGYQSCMAGVERGGHLSGELEKCRDMLDAVSCEAPASERRVINALMMADEIIADMVAAEDALIADLKASGDHEAILRMEFPVMKRMRAYLADRAANSEPLQ